MVGAPLTNSWFLSGDGEKRPPANVTDAHGWRFRRDSAQNGETRKWRKHLQLRGYGRRETLTNGRGMVLKKELAPQVGLEPTTLRLTAECSAIELLRNKLLMRERAI